MLNPLLRFSEKDQPEDLPDALVKDYIERMQEENEKIRVIVRAFMKSGGKRVKEIPSPKENP
jgi:hypothetical protein